MMSNSIGGLLFKTYIRVYISIQPPTPGIHIWYDFTSCHSCGGPALSITRPDLAFQSDFQWLQTSQLLLQAFDARC